MTDDWQYVPAKDRHLSPEERWRSLQREPGLISALTQSVWRLAAKSYLRLYHRLRIVGAEHLPGAAPFVMIANHSSHLDALTLAAALPWRLRQCAFPIAAGDTFFQTNVSAFFSAMALNALPMWRRRCGAHALDDLRARLVNEPAIYILFPEGTRTRDGRMGRFKPGLGKLVAGTNAPVVPCHLHGAFAALPPGAKRPTAAKLTLRIGEPLDFSTTPDDRESWQRIAAECEARVERLRASQSQD